MIVTALTLAACRPAEPAPDGTDAPQPTGGTGTAATTGDTAAPPPTGDTGPATPEYDCATVPLQPTGYREVPGARGYHDVAFDEAGYLIGQTVSGDLSRTDFDGNFSVWVPGVGTIQQMTWLPTGDLAVASEQRGIVLVAPSGASTVVNGDIRPYGLILGPDGLLWSANQDQVHKIDPVTGAAEVVVARNALARGSPRVIAFDLAYTKLVIGTLSGTQGRLYAVDLDANFDPVGDPYEFATDVGRGGYHDTLGVDLCGYYYVADYETSALYRITPDGTQVQTLLDAGVFPGLGPYGHGLDWGNGVGGWLTDAIYLSQPYSANHVMEVTIGVPSREHTGLVPINLP